MEQIKDYQFLILSDDKDRDQHERNLYKAFYEKYPWYAKRFFKVVANERLIPNIPYSDQIIYGAKNNRDIIISFSACTNLENTETEQIGFSIPKDKAIIEGLHFYGNLDKSRFFGMEEIYTAFMNYALGDLKQKGYNKIYSTCSRRLLIVYKKMDFQVQESLEVDGDTEYLIMREL
ncbi:MAG: hypothetical protein MJB14_21125 [Spirochaetes bacterium]|nr:hypothetical protein [Spirochaetota bacterium]